MAAFCEFWGWPLSEVKRMTLREYGAFKQYANKCIAERS